MPMKEAPMATLEVPPLCILLYFDPALFAYVNQSTAFVAMKGHHYQHL
jgi:hypothetical protein